MLHVKTRNGAEDLPGPEQSEQQNVVGAARSKRRLTPKSKAEATTKPDLCWKYQRTLESMVLHVNSAEVADGPLDHVCSNQLVLLLRQRR